MKKYYRSAIQLFRQIRSDNMFLASFLVPVILGVAIRFGIPAVEGILTSHYQTSQILTPYYPLFDLFLAMIAPIMFCFSFAMIMLEEIDDKVSRYYMVTPLGKAGYLLSRMGIPAVVALVFTPIILFVFQISGMGFFTVLCVALLGTLMAVIIALMIVSLSSNKLEGMAVTKLSAILTVGILPPFFVKGPAEYLFSFLPSYWLSKTILASSFVPIVAGVVVSALWLFVLAKRFGHKVSV